MDALRPLRRAGRARASTATPTGARSGSCAGCPHDRAPRASAHWYGTDPGHRWTELFAVFTGPLFDSLADSASWPAPVPATRGPLPSIEALRTVLRHPAALAAGRGAPAARAGRLAARHPGRRPTEPAGPDLSPEVADGRRPAGRRPDRQRRPADPRRGIGLSLRHVPAPVHRAGRPVAIGVPHRAAAPDGRHPAPAHRHDPPRDRPDPGLRRRVPLLPAVPCSVRRLAARLPALLRGGRIPTGFDERGPSATGQPARVSLPDPPCGASAGAGCRLRGTRRRRSRTRA